MNRTFLIRADNSVNAVSHCCLPLAMIRFAETVQELLGHEDVRTTMVHTPVLAEGVEGRVLNRSGLGVRSRLDH